jgi:hypothetical protein
VYRWGFRQVNRGIGPDDPIIFGNEYFQRDDAELMAKMRSTTAASTRKQEEDNLQKMLAQKRALDSWEADRDQKHMLFNSLMQQNMLQQNFGNLQPNGIQNFQPNPFLIQSLQQNLQQQQQQQQFGNAGTQNMPLMNAFRNLPSSSNNNTSDATMSGFKAFEILAAQQQQQQQHQQQQHQGNGNNADNFNPLLNFQLPASNNGLVMNNMNGMSSSNNLVMNSMPSMSSNRNMMNINSISMNGSMNNFTNNNMLGPGTGGGNQNSATTADIVNAAINALKHAP